MTGYGFRDRFDGQMVVKEKLLRLSVCSRLKTVAEVNRGKLRLKSVHRMDHKPSKA